MNKINVFRIVRDHFGTLRNYQTGELSAADVIIFIVLPVAVASVCSYEKISFDKDALIAVLTAFSIFAGLLFSLLILVFSLTEKTEPQSMLYSVRKQLIGELYENISFAILVSIALVTVTIVAATFRYPAPDGGTGLMATFLLVLLMSNFILTILMILKRMHALLTLALKEQAIKKRA